MTENELVGSGHHCLLAAVALCRAELVLMGVATGTFNHRCSDQLKDQQTASFHHCIVCKFISANNMTLNAWKLYRKNDYLIAFFLFCFYIMLKVEILQKKKHKKKRQ